MKIRILFLVIVFFFIVVNVNGQEECCLSTELTYCVEEGFSECETLLSGVCDEHAECSVRGACIDLNENICDDGYPQIRCTGSNKEFHPYSECIELEGFRNVCCALTEGGYGGFAFMPESECTSGQFEEISEFDCRQRQLGADSLRGCCVSSDGLCTYGLDTGCEEGLFQPYFCSTLVEQCNPVCEPRASIKPGPERFGMQYDIYYHDSCGNLDSNVPAVDCRDMEEMPVLDNGRWTCGPAKCETLWDNPKTDENHDGILDNDDNFHGRSYRLNGESWCEYQQARVGPGLDLPGSKHFKHYCDYGIEKVETSESAAVGREKICIESEVDTSQGIMYGARWEINNPAVCNSCTDGARDGRLNGEQFIECCNAGPCAYIPRKTFGADDERLLFLSEGLYSWYRFARSGSAWLDMIYKKQGTNEQILRHKIDGSAANNNPLLQDEVPGIYEGCERIGPFSGFFSCQCRGNVCALRLKSIPDDPEVLDDTYDIAFAGEWDVAWAPDPYFSEGFIDSLNFNSVGACVPLVPPSGNEYCSLGNSYEQKPYMEINYYYEMPYNSLGLGGECGDIEECRGLFNNDPGTLSYRNFIMAYADNANTFCRAWGDCGIAPGLGGSVSDSGLEISSSEGSGAICFAGTIGDESMSPYCLDRNNLKGNVSEIEGNKFDTIISGSASRPEDFSPTFVFFFIPFGFSRKRKKILLLLLIIAVLFLSSCGDAPDVQVTLPPDSGAECTKWEPPSSSDDCGECTKKQSEGGLLPDANLTNIDGIPAYVCTPALCSSLGRCAFVSDEDGIRCIPNVATEFTVPKIQFTQDISYTCNAYEESECRPGGFEIRNNEADDFRQGALLEIAGELEPLTPINVEFRTVAANGDSIGQEFPTACTYGIDNSGADELFEEAGRTSPTHELVIPPLPTKLGSYSIYVKCQNPLVYEATVPGVAENSYDIAEIRFRIGDAPDLGPPAFLEPDWIEPAEAFVKHGDSALSVKINLRGNVESCRWDNENVEFDEMGVGTEPGSGITSYSNIFTCTDDKSNGMGAAVCRTTLDGIVQGENKFWFACEGTNGEKTDPHPDSGYLVTGTGPLNITNVKCIHSLGEDCGTIYDSSFDFSIETAGGAQQGSAGCLWSLGDYAFDVFDEPGGLLGEPEFATTHTEREFSRPTGVYTLKFMCEDIAGNEAETEVAIDLQRDQTAPRITRVYREGSMLNLETDEPTTCIYISDAGGNFDSAVQFTDSGSGLEHSTSIEGNFYRIRCADRFDNYRQTDVYVN